MRQCRDARRFRIIRNSSIVVSSNETNPDNDTFPVIKTLRDCLNMVNKEFELSLGRETILALWNKRKLRKFTPKELFSLYGTVIEELMYVKDPSVKKQLGKLKTKVVEVMINDKFKKKEP